MSAELDGGSIACGQAQGPPRCCAFGTRNLGHKQPRPGGRGRAAQQGCEAAGSRQPTPLCGSASGPIPCLFLAHCAGALVYPRGSEELPTQEEIDTAIANMKVSSSGMLCKACSKTGAGAFSSSNRHPATPASPPPPRPPVPCRPLHSPARAAARPCCPTSSPAAPAIRKFKGCEDA